MGVGSHSHSDLIGGLVTVLERHAVSHYLDAGQFYGSWTAKRIRELVERKGIRYWAVAAGDSLIGLGGEADSASLERLCLGDGGRFSWAEQWFGCASPDVGKIQHLTHRRHRT